MIRTEYILRLIDTGGDAQEVRPQPTKRAAMLEAQRALRDGECSAVVVERVVTDWLADGTIASQQTEVVYSEGLLGALVAGGWRT